MLEESEAVEQILSKIDPAPEQWLPLLLARGSCLSQNLHCLVDSPEFDNSSMDGYALRARDAALHADLTVLSEQQPAGVDLQLELTEGQAIRIFTGAPIPSGATAVIMQEDVERTGDTIKIMDPVRQGENIRRQGGDVCRGQTLMRAGETLSPTHLALIATQGVDEVPVYCKPLVHIVTTGDELVDPGYHKLPGQIYNSNATLLQTAVEEMGAHVAHTHILDDPETTKSELERILQSSDMVVIAGGMSVGDHDYVKPALEEIGVSGGFWRVRVKPGKPFLFGQSEAGTHVFGLPGNPVSAYVTFLLFVAPAIRKRMGHQVNAEDRFFEATALEPLINSGNRPHYLRGIATDNGVRLSGTQQSHAIFGLSRANCLVRLPEDSVVQAGSQVQCLKI